MVRENMTLGSIRWRTLVLGVVAAAAAAPALASGLSWPQRAGDAPLQIVARCDSRTSRWEGGTIYSYSEVSVLQVVKGAPGDRLTVRQRGGEVDGIGQKVSHVSLLEPGRSYLLFLDVDPTSAWSPTSSGVNVLEESDTGQTVGGEPLEQVLSDLGGAQ
jgi:hypothetical protein